MPPKSAPGYDLRAIYQWLQERNGQVSGDARQRLDAAKAGLAELELAQKKSELIPRIGAEKEKLRLTRAFVSILEQLGADIAGRIAGKTPKECRKIVDQRVRELRTELAK